MADAELDGDLVLLLVPEALRLFGLIPASPLCSRPDASPALVPSLEQSVGLVGTLVLGFSFPLTLQKLSLSLFFYLDKFILSF